GGPRQAHRRFGPGRRGGQARRPKPDAPGPPAAQPAWGPRAAVRFYAPAVRPRAATELFLRRDVQAIQGDSAKGSALPESRPPTPEAQGVRPRSEVRARGTCLRVERGLTRAWGGRREGLPIAIGNWMGQRAARACCRGRGTP